MYACTQMVVWVKLGHQWTHKIGDLYNQNLKGDDSFDMFWHIPKSLKQRSLCWLASFGASGVQSQQHAYGGFHLWWVCNLWTSEPGKLEKHCRKNRMTWLWFSELPGTSSETGIILWRTVLAADSGLKGSPTIPDPEIVTHQLSVTRTLATRSWPTETLQFQARSCISWATGKPTSSSNSWDYDWEILA